MSADPQADDELLVWRCQEGDATAFDELLGRWQERWWRQAWRLTGNEQAAWDVLQEASVVIARDLRKLQTASAFAAWAYRIMSHKSRDWLRQHVRRREREAEFAERLLLDQEGPAVPPTRVERLREVFPRLADADRALLALRFEDGLGLEEIAALLAIPAGTVKSRLHHAKQRLRTLMEETL